MIKKTIIFISLFCCILHAEEKKVALLFLTRSDLHHSSLWQTVLSKTIYRDHFNIYVHSKDEMTDPYFSQFRIKKHLPTSWSNTILAQQALLQEALEDTTNVKFVFLSETCVPLQKLDKIYQILTEDDKTFLSYCLPWWPDGDRTVFDLPVQHRLVNQQWVILNRWHAEMLAIDNEITNIIARYTLDNESWPSSALSALGALDMIENKKTTYVNWQDPAEDGYLPRQFRDASFMNIEFIRNAKRDGYLFGRKFMKSFPDDILLQILEEEI